MSGGGGGLPSMVLARGTTNEVKGDVWVHRRRLGVHGGSGGDQQMQGSGRGGDSNLFFRMHYVFVGSKVRRLGVS